MARKVPGFAHGKERRYIPEAFDNRDDEEPIVVWIKTPTERQKREVMQSAAAAFERDDRGSPILDEDGAPQMKLDLAYSMRWQNAVVEKFVVRVENYAASDGSQIKTAAQFLDFGETEIVSELSAEIITGLSLGEEEKKPSPGSSDTMQKMTPARAGTAENVGPGDSRSSVGAA